MLLDISCVTDLTDVIDDLDTFLVVLGLELSYALPLFCVFFRDIFPKSSSEVLKLLALTSELGADDRGSLDDLLALRSDFWTALEYASNDAFVIQRSISKLRRWWHDEQLHGFPEIQM